MENVEKKSWSKLENGKYAIFNVDIFQTFKDESRGEVNEKTAKEVIKNFEQDKKTGYYPRLHLGHHAPGYENQPGVGYIDNLKFKSGTFFADFVELDQEFFEKVKEGNKYPYRSTEFDPKDNRILSVAILESRPPYFKFPILAVEENPKLQFQMMFSLDEKGQKMAEEEKKEAPPKDAPQEPQKAQEAPQAPQDPLMACMQEIKTMLASLLQLEQKEQAMQPAATQAQEGITVPAKPTKEIATEVALEESIKKPNSVAYQSPEAQKFEKEIQKLRGEIEALKTQGTHESRLKVLCDGRKLNFQHHSKVLGMFQDETAKANYLTMLETENVPAVDVPVNQFQAKFPIQGIIDKFQSESPDLQNLAKKVYQDYCDTVNQSDKKAADLFQSIWPNVDKFVSHVVETEKVSPGYYQKFSY